MPGGYSGKFSGTAGARREPFTNADRLRSMSDEEHARFIVRAVSDGCPPDMNWDCQKDKDGWDACDKCWARWLRHPADK